jgi:hypothetical protein
MRRNGCLFLTIGLPAALLLLASLSSFIWVKAIIADGGLKGKKSIMCISARDRLNYDVDDPPPKIVTGMLTSMLRTHSPQYSQQKMAMWHVKGFVIQSTLMTFWSTEERRILYRVARPSIKDCR